MQKRTREITALVFLIVLAIGLVAAMAWYIRIGHNWTLAATIVDDIVGSMDRYTVVVYGGTSGAHSAESATATDDVPADGLTFREQALIAKGDELARFVATSYRDKGAATVELDLGDLGLYADPLYTTKGGKRIGIVSVNGPAAYIHAWQLSQEMRKNGVVTVIAVFSNAPAPGRQLVGVDIAAFVDGSVPESGLFAGSAFVAGNPPAGTVQAILVPQTGVISTKVIDAL